MNGMILDTKGKEVSGTELPAIFQTPYRQELIHKAYVNLASHRYQPQGRHPTAGMDVVADSNDPPTGHGTSRVARARGGGGGRQGQGAEVASTRGGRQAHPPNVAKVIHKRLNKKENKLALCSAVAATASHKIVESRGHKAGDLGLPIILEDDIEQVSQASQMRQILDALHLSDDVKRLENRRRRSGQPRLRGRGKKTGKSVLFVAKDSSRLELAAGAIPGVEAQRVDNLSVLDLAPGGVPARLVIYSKSAMQEIAKIKSTHLEVMAKVE